jgi:hypothetical protein
MDPIISNYLKIKSALKEKVPQTVVTQKQKKKEQQNEQYLAGSEGTINEIISKKPKLKYVVEYLQARADELNQAELNA